MNDKKILTQYYELVNRTNIVSKTDKYGFITYANCKFEEISGYSKEELIGQPHNILRDPDMSSELFKELWETLQSKQTWNGIITNLRKDGSKYTVDASIFPVLDENNEIYEYIAIRHDITQIQELTKEVQSLHDYNIFQENIAREKLESGIVNDMTKKECQILYHPSDILSGDFYSIYKLNNGSTFIYLMDGQGHGVSPALTVFAISSMMNKLIYNVNSIEELMQELSSNVKNFLAEEEQLSYTMIMISEDRKKISYSCAGMYPFPLKHGETTMKSKAKNFPFMNFSDTPSVDELTQESWDSLFIYSDGLVEDEISEMNDTFLPQNLIMEPKKLQERVDEILKLKFDDDVTFIHLSNS